ncbi:hypothetical protein ACUXNS_000848 [Brevibacterium pityocampae]
MRLLTRMTSAIARSFEAELTVRRCCQAVRWALTIRSAGSQQESP